MSVSSSKFKKQFQRFLSLFQSEVSRTTQIGKKMLDASKETEKLSQAKQKLGESVLNLVKKQKISFEDENILSLIDDIKSIEKKLKKIEQNVSDLRFSQNYETK